MTQTDGALLMLNYHSGLPLKYKPVFTYSFPQLQSSLCFIKQIIKVVFLQIHLHRSYTYPT